MSAICSRCAEPLVDAERPCVFCTCELVGKIVELTGTETDRALLCRAEAVSSLRELGYSQRQVLLLRAKAIEGKSVEQILEGLVDGAERGVAA